jgi:peptidylprolyl isomerase
MAEQPDTVKLELKSGTVTIELLPQLAPNHVQRIKELARDGFYDGLPFHRVITGFMAQTGDPTGTGSGKSSKPNLKAEFSREPHVRGVCSMARSNDPNSANSQFFICLADAPWLDGQYSVWGRVIDGMDHVDAIKKGSSSNNGAVLDPDRIIKMTLP